MDAVVEAGIITTLSAGNNLEELRLLAVIQLTVPVMLLYQ